MTDKSLVDVYVMHGLFGMFFRKAMYPIAATLKSKGYNTMMLGWQSGSRKKILKNAIKRHKLTKGKNKVVIVGHSMGGNAATILSKEFKEHGLTIDYMAVVDAPMPKRIYSSVSLVHNFYQFNDWRDPVVVANNRNTTTIKHYNYRRKDKGPGEKRPHKGHIAIASDPFLKGTVYATVAKL